MKPIRTFRVAPRLPEAVAGLHELAYNLYWSWRPEVIELFRRVDRDLWERVGHNPVRLIGEVKQSRFEELAGDEGFLAQLRRLQDQLHDYLCEEGYVQRACEAQQLRVAYFCAEFGLTESLPLYSGGLGMLAGDHVKSASDLAVPLVGVGLLYQKGYFQQVLNSDGWQQDRAPINDFYNMPVTEELDDEGQPRLIEVDYPGGPVTAKIWRIQVGRVPLILLDTNIAENTNPDDRDITDQLYGGNLETRVRQEIMLGIGGLRALDALDLRPAVCHMNEGHAAFLSLELTRRHMAEHSLSFDEARELTRAACVFTTHTPVKAGHDEFGSPLMEKYFRGYYPQLGLTSRDFLALGRANPNDPNENFSMTVLALNMACSANGVSRLHGEVSRTMMAHCYPGVPVDEVPILHVTNGVHARSWVSLEMAELYDQYVGPRWADDPMDRAVWERVGQIPDEELWRIHEMRRGRLVAFARRRLRTQLERGSLSPRQLELASEVLDPKILTIGFARRFATYKRATLVMRDVERLVSILNHADRPAQIIFAGKSHPADNNGKELIRQVIHLSQRDDLHRRIVFLEDYDHQVGRFMTQGADVWLNTPLRPNEASGTSGMKVVFNGGLNCSIPDGWWPEGYNGRNGWTIGRGESYGSTPEELEYQNEIESRMIYDLLEREIAPLFYDRSADGLPRGWVERMKNSMRTLAPIFNTNRMVLEYTRRFYLTAGLRASELAADGQARAKALAAWTTKLRADWPNVAVTAVEAESTGLDVGDKQAVTARVVLGGLTPDDVTVQVYHGAMDSSGQIVEAAVVDLKQTGESDGTWSYTGQVTCSASGLRGFTVRVIPRHADLPDPMRLGLVRWADGADPTAEA